MADPKLRHRLSLKKINYRLFKLILLISAKICQYFSTASALTETNVKYDEHILNVGNK